MIKKILINAIEKGVEEISIQKASKCMLFVYQPKVPKCLVKKLSK
jgi:cyclic lactone autoinducer peptide